MEAMAVEDLAAGDLAEEHVLQAQVRRV